jgi:sugar/nucleoside kinase (ribokinase family)
LTKVRRVTCPDLVVVGAASQDIDPEDARGWRLGGTVAYAALTAARFGLHIGCLIGLGPETRGADELSCLSSAGVELRPVLLEHGPIFQNIELAGRREQRWHSRSDQLPAECLPKDWADARGWLFAPVADELDDDWAKVPNDAAIVGVGWQGMLRSFIDDGLVVPSWPSPSAILARADLVVASLADFPGNATMASLTHLLRSSASLVVTAGESGGLVLEGRHISRYRAVPAQSTVDPVGAGDVFTAAMLAARLVLGDATTTGRALHVAAAAAAASLEGAGVCGVPTPTQIARCLDLPVANRASDPAIVITRSGT